MPYYLELVRFYTSIIILLIIIIQFVNFSQIHIFSSGSEVCVVKEMHKESLVPILIR